MKTFKIIVLLSLLSSCGSMLTLEFITIYSADSMGKHKCDPYTVNMTWDYLVNYSKDANEAMKTTGYSNCNYDTKTNDEWLTSCKSPMLYKSYTTLSMAKCHMFMKENNLK